AVQCVLPIVVREGGEASARCRRPANIVDQNFDTAEAVPHSADDLLRSLSRAEVGFHEQSRLKQVMGSGSRGGDHHCSRTPETFDDGFAYSSRATGHKRALACEFGFGESAHPCISTRTLFSPSNRVGISGAQFAAAACQVRPALCSGE